MKQKIQAAHEMQADQLKLIFGGKVLDDDSKSIKDYAIKENDFVIVMVQKVKIGHKNLSA